MDIVLAKSAGFCFGVKRAVNSVYDEIENHNTGIYTYGPIIHNEQVVQDMESKRNHPAGFFEKVWKAPGP